MLELNKQQSLSFHSELYKLIPEDHILVQIHKLVDFSFILDFVKDQYNLFYGRKCKGSRNTVPAAVYSEAVQFVR